MMDVAQLIKNSLSRLSNNEVAVLTLVLFFFVYLATYPFLKHIPRGFYAIFFFDNNLFYWTS